VIARWHLAAIAVGWTLAAVVIYLSGVWYAQINRYDECSYMRVGTQAAYLCPLGEVDRPEPTEPAPEEA